MILQALLVSNDDQTAETLIQALARFGVAVARSSAADVAVERLNEERFDQVIIDFDDAQSASLMLEACRRVAGPDRNPPVTVAVLSDPVQIRSILGAGAHFILVKPVSPESAQATLRAAVSILKRERRQSARVAVQAPVSLHPDDNTAVEGIMLDLSTGGMDVLSAKPLANGAMVRVSFELPDANVLIEGDAEVAWSTPNGQTGLRFLDMDAKLREELAAWLGTRSRDVLPDEASAASECKLTDLSLGGCYVETDSPFPQSSAVDLCLRAAGMEIHADGIVRVMHPGHGMGIEFPSRTEEQRKTVTEFIEFLTSQPGTQPQLGISPRSLVASSVELSHPTGEGEGDDALLGLLRSGGEMAEQEFLNELTRQRTPADVNP
jgi:DNA-binding response OmpR family regulator